MPVKVYACMIVLRKDNSLVGFKMVKHWSSKKYSQTEIKKRIQADLPLNQKTYGQLFIVARHGGPEWY